MPCPCAGSMPCNRHLTSAAIFFSHRRSPQLRSGQPDNLLLFCEDIARHNALDKAVSHAAARTAKFLFSAGGLPRTCFQKLWPAGSSCLLRRVRHRSHRLKWRRLTALPCWVLCAATTSIFIPARKGYAEMNRTQQRLAAGRQTQLAALPPERESLPLEQAL